MDKLIERLLNEITIKEDVSSELVETYLKITALLAELRTTKHTLELKMTDKEKDESLRILEEAKLN